MDSAVKKIYIQIAVSLPVNGTFTYSVCGDMMPQADVGKRVLTSFSGRKVIGYILRKIPAESRKGVKDIASIIDHYPLFPPNMVEFFEWLSSYYHYPIGLVIKTALPPGLNVNIRDGKYPNPEGWLDRVGLLKKPFISIKKGISFDRSLTEQKRAPRNEKEFLEMMLKNREVSLHELTKTFRNGAYLADKWIKKGFLNKSLKTVVRDISGDDIFISPRPPSLNSTQKEVLEEISGKIKENRFRTYLLHGVTSSGKTEVYYHAARAAIQRGKQAIVMVPEIALTVALASLFKARLNERVAILHSALSPGQRYGQWITIAKGKADIVIGARSALFAPLPNLGLIILDEEHDPSYKQEETFRYQARDAAIVRAKLSNALVILGSGTPSIQSYFNALSGKYGLLTMPERVFKKEPPEITIIDMARVEGKKNSEGILSSPLREAIKGNLERGEQTILFLNRRGFSVLYLCRFCGETVRCPNCSVSLTYHKNNNNLLCHYCGFKIQPPERCPACNRESLKPYGFGTEKVVETLGEVFPEARVDRMDRDTMRHKGEVQQVLRRFLHYGTDILVGTQMVTKGHDFPNVTLVGVISADLSLNWPDFRAGETTFQLLSQVAGRTGRGSSPGKVIIQTYNPSHYAISAAKDHDYRRFFTREIRLRQQLKYPPFSSIANLRFQGNSKLKTEEIARQMRMKISEILRKQLKGKRGIEVLGPAEAPIARLKGKYRHQILIKSQHPRYLHHLVNEVHKVSTQLFRASGVRIIIDIDPYQMI
jgi:primosomal protein N' (replication factor Y)